MRGQQVYLVRVVHGPVVTPLLPNDIFDTEREAADAAFDAALGIADEYGIAEEDVECCDEQHMVAIGNLIEHYVEWGEAP